MKLDSENDRNLLLDMISKATVQGSAVLMLADLVQRISAAELEVPVVESQNQGQGQGV